MPNVGRSAPNGKEHVQSVLFDKTQWDKKRCAEWLANNKYSADGLDETDSLLRYRQFDPDSGAFDYRSNNVGKGITLIFGFPVTVRAKQVNYDVTEEGDGTWTIRNVEILAKGTWRASGVASLPVSDKELVEAVRADAAVRQYTQPVLLREHTDHAGTRSTEKIGALGPISKSDSTGLLLCDFLGLSEEDKDWIVSGKAGRISPEIRLGWTEPATNTRWAFLVTGAAFTQGDMPACTSIKPIVTFTEEATATLVRLVERIDEGVKPQGHVTEEDPMTDAEKAQLEKDKKDLETREAQLKADQEDQRKERERMTDQKVNSGIAMLVHAKRLDPKKVDEVREDLAAMDDSRTVKFTSAVSGKDAEGTAVDRYLDRKMGDDEVVLESTKSEGTPQGEGEKDLGPDDVLIARGQEIQAEYAKIGQTISLTEAVLEAEATGRMTKGDKILDDYRKVNFRERTATESDPDRRSNLEDHG